MKNTIFISILFLCCHVYAIDKMPIEKKEWLSQMKVLMPTEICKDTSLFRSCYTTTTEDCQLTYEKSFSICSKQINKQIPKIIENYEISQDLGGKLGGCVASEYVLIMEKRENRNSVCDEMFGKKMIQRDFNIELIIGLLGFLVFFVSIYISKKINKKPYKILLNIFGFLLSLITIALVSYLIDSESIDLNYNSGQFLGGFIFIYLIIIAKKKPKNKS